MKNTLINTNGADTSAAVAATGAALENQVAGNIGLTLNDSQQRLLERLPLDSRSPLRDLFDPLAKQRRKGELRIQELELSHQVRQLGLIREVEAQTLRCVLSHFVREGKLGLQGRSAAYAEARRSELLERVEQTINEHQARVKHAWEQIPGLPEPIRECEAERIISGYKAVVEDVREMLAQFSQITQEVLPETRG